MVTSKYFDLAISAVIGLNVITMAMEFYMMPRVSTTSLHEYIYICMYNIIIITFVSITLIIDFLGTKLCVEGVQLLLHIRVYTGSCNEDICPWMWTVYE